MPDPVMTRIEVAEQLAWDEGRDVLSFVVEIRTAVAEFMAAFIELLRDPQRNRMAP